MTDETFKLEIVDVGQIEFGDDYCANIGYDDESLKELMTLCHVPKDEDYPDEFLDDAADDFMYELEDKIKYGCMFQYAVPFYNQTISRDDIRVYTEIHGEFTLRGVKVQVDYEGTEDELYSCAMAEKMLEDQTYTVTVNGKKLDGMEFSLEDGERLYQALTDKAKELQINIDPASDWNTMDDWEEKDGWTDIADLLEDIEYDGFIVSYDIDLVRPENKLDKETKND